MITKQNRCKFENLTPQKSTTGITFVLKQY